MMADGTPAYAQKLAQLREHGEEVLATLERSYRATPHDNAIRRGRIADALSDLQMHATEPLLSEIAREPLAIDRSALADEHGGIPAQSEAVVRFAAMEGLRDLSLRGNREAEATLKTIMVSGDPLLRREAVSLFLEAGENRRTRQAEAAALLDRADAWMVHVVQITSADQAPPRSGAVSRTAGAADRPKGRVGSPP